MQTDQVNNLDDKDEDDNKGTESSDEEGFDVYDKNGGDRHE